MDLSETAMQLLLGVFPLAGAAVTQCIGQCKIFVERVVAGGGDRCSLVERGECNTPSFPIGRGPDRNRIVPLRNDPTERFGGIRSWKAMCKFTAIRRERVFQTMDQEFLDSGEIGSIVQFRSVEEACSTGTLHRGVNF